MNRVVPIGGLGNRLRSIFSHRAKHGAIEVLWARSEAVSKARWEDVFEPLAGVTFTDIGEIHAHDYTGPHEAMYEQIAVDVPDGWTKGYVELRPVQPVNSRIDELTADLDGPYFAIHARRSDHVEHVKQFGGGSTNEELFNAYACLTELDDSPNPRRPSLYLATDDPATQRWFRACGPAMGGQVIVARDVHGTDGAYEVRTGSLADAVVDMFVCARAAAGFRGSWMSSFSETIELLRCGGEPPGGFVIRHHMPSGDAEYYRGRPDLAQARIAKGYNL